MRRILLAALVLFTACASSAPQVTREPAFPLDWGTVHVGAVDRVEFKPRIAAALAEAGIAAPTGRADMDYTLKVDVGAPQFFSNAHQCGSLRNVRFSLQLAEGATAFQMVGRGPEGPCAHDVWQMMASALADQMRFGGS